MRLMTENNPPSSSPVARLAQMHYHSLILAPRGRHALDDRDRLAQAQVGAGGLHALARLALNPSAAGAACA